MYKINRKKNINWFAIGILALPLIVAGSYLWVTSIFSAIENYRSPLADSAPEPGTPLGQPLTGRVVLVIVDALRYDTSTDISVMPELDQLRTMGASAQMSSRPPSFSAPGWTTILTGAWPDINDSQPFNPPDEDSVRSFTQDDIFAAADRIGLDTAIAGYFWFDQMLKNSGLDTSFFTMGEDDAADQEVMSHALPWLDDEYALILIHLDQVDFAGHHEGGVIDPHWDQAAARVDTMIGRLADNLDLTRETILIVSDHGQIDKGGHGGAEPVTLLEPFIAAGAGIVPGQYSPIQMVDIAPTVAVLLGTNIPATNQGRPLLELVEVSTDQAVAILDAEMEQQSALLAAYAQAIGQSVEIADTEAIVSSTQMAMEQARMGKLAQERIWRNMIALFLAILPGYFLFLQREKRTLWLIVAALIYLGIFNLRYLLLDKNPYGLSWITGMMDFILYIAVTTGIAIIPAWLISMLGLRSLGNTVRKSAADALGIVWFIIYLLAIPILLNFSVNGMVADWTLPQFTVQYLGFFFLCQVLFVSVIGLLLVGMSAGIGYLRHKSLHLSSR